MSNLETLRVLVNERLAATADDIVRLFARTVTEYEDQLCRLKQENERQRKLLHVVLAPDVRLNRADVQLDAEPPCIKEEKEQQSISWEGELHNSLVGKSEDVKEEPQSSVLLSQRPTEGESPVNHTTRQRVTDTESVCNSNPQRFLQSAENVETAVVCEPEAKLKPLDNTGVPEFEYECNTDTECVASSECGKTHNDVAQSYMQNSLGELVCIKEYAYSGKKTFTCTVCKKRFSTKSGAMRHIATHTRETLFGCSFCGKTFNQRTRLVRHVRGHTEERPFSCTVCHKRFVHSGILATHMRVHTGEKPYMCSVCNSSFSYHQSLSKHMRIHTGEKPFSCTVCGKKFTQKCHLTQHMPVHTGERLFSCHVCGKRFSRRCRVKQHKCVTGSSSSSSK